MDYTEYCDVGDHEVEEDEIVRGSEANSCVGCQEKCTRTTWVNVLLIGKQELVLLMDSSSKK